MSNTFPFVQACKVLSFYNEPSARRIFFCKIIIKYQKKEKKLARTIRCQVFPPGALPRGDNCVELASGGLAGATLSREIDL